MTKRRVYELANDLKVDKEALVAVLQRAGVAVRNYMSAIEPEAMTLLWEYVKVNPDAFPVDERRKQRAPDASTSAFFPPPGARGCFWSGAPLGVTARLITWSRAGALRKVGPDLCLELLDAQMGYLRELFALLPSHDALVASNARVFHLDLAELPVGYPSMVAPICSWIAREDEWLRGRVLNLIPPREKSVARWLDDIGFTDVVLLAAAARRERFVSMALSEIRPDDTDAAYAITDKLVALIRKTHIPITDDALNSLGVAASEIIENSVRHARMSTPGYACAQVHPASNKLSICIADSGIGIEESFKTAPYDPARERLLAGESPLALAIEPLMSSKYGMGHSGYGLFYASTLCELAHGTFVLSSGAESYTAHPNKQEFERHANWQGTIVNVLLDTRSEIDGRRVWERLPAIDEDEYRGSYADVGTLPVSLSLSTIGDRLYTRDKARTARQHLSLEGDKRIVVSFDGVIVMTPSFADELFGALYAEMGRERYAKTVVVVDADPYMKALIEMVLLHRDRGPSLIVQDG